MASPSMPEHMEGLRQAIVRGDYAGAIALTESALRAGEPAARILSEGMMPAMEQLGSDFSAGAAFLPELIAGGHAMSEAAKLFAQYGAQSEASRGAPAVVLGTAEGDLHDIGKNIVIITMRAAGLEVLDLGVDVSTERFVQAARESGAQLVGISALLSTTMRTMEATVRELHAHTSAKVMVGGAPVTEAYARSIGAEGYAPDAYRAAHRALELLAFERSGDVARGGDRP
jgi:5-methyltetrahydrofolate--homocysteine methyltransferase